MLFRIHFIISIEHFLISLDQKDIIHQETDESKENVGGFHCGKKRSFNAGFAELAGTHHWIMENFIHIKISYLITKSVDTGFNLTPKITLCNTLGAHGINTLELNNFEHKLGATLDRIEINNHVAAFSSELHGGVPRLPRYYRA